MKRLISLLFAAAPLAVGLFRALGPHHDLRFLAMAVVALLVATLFLSVARKPGSPTPSWSMSAAAFVAATALAACVTYLMGAPAAAGVWMVAVVMAFCCVASAWLGARAGGVGRAT